MGRATELISFVNKRYAPNVHDSKVKYMHLSRKTMMEQRKIYKKLTGSKVTEMCI